MSKALFALGHFLTSGPAQCGLHGTFFELSATMALKRVVVLMACSAVALLFTGCGNTERAGVGQIRGDYAVVSRLMPHSKERVTLEVVISFECPACFRFDAGMTEISKKFGSRIMVQWVPVSRSGGSGLPEHLYLLAERNGLGDVTRHALFEARFKRDLDIQQRSVIETIGRQVGLPSSILAQLDDPALRDEQAAQNQSVSQYAFYTPSILVEDQLLVPPDTGALTLVINDLLASNDAQGASPLK